MGKKREYILMLFLLLVFQAFSQLPNVIFTHLTTADGLSSNHVTDILQDSTGYIWIATKEGLNRFDGQRIKAFRHNPNDSTTIRSYDIQCLELDAQGNLWMGTGEGLLQCYRPDTDQFEAYPVPLDSAVKVTAIWDVEVDAEGQLWLGLEGGLARFDPVQKSFLTWQPTLLNPDLDSRAYNIIYSVQPDLLNGHIIWCGSRWGLLRFDTRNESIELVAPPDSLAKFATGIFDIIQRPSGKLCFSGAYCSVFIFDGVDGWQRFSHPTTPLGPSPRSLLPKKDNEWWITDAINGLGLLDERTGRIQFFPPGQFPSQGILPGGAEAVFQDNQGTVWIGMEDGICRIIPAMQQFHHTELPATGELTFAKSFLQKNNSDTLLVGAGRGKSIFVSLKTGKVLGEIGLHATGMSPEKFSVYSISADGNGVIWFGTSKGMFILNEKTMALHRPGWPNDAILAKFVGLESVLDKRGNLWLSGSGARLAHLDIAKQQIEVFDHENNSIQGFPKLDAINGLAIDGQGRIWFGGDPYLVHFDPAIGHFTAYSKEKNCTDCMASTWVQCIATTTDGAVWVGYKHGGLDRFEPVANGNKFRHIGVQDGLPSNKVYRLVSDGDGSIWAATGNGLCRIGTDFSITHFTEKDGLRENDFHRYWQSSLYATTHSSLVFGGQKYFTIFDPKQLRNNYFESNLKLNGIRVFDREKRFEKNINLLPEIELNHRENFFTLEFSDLNSSGISGTTFRYRLNGFDDNWRETTSNFAPFTNVGGGRYTFRLQVLGNDGKWQEDHELKLAIRVWPPFWQMAWFRVLVLGAMGLMAWFFYKMRIRQVREQEQLNARFERQLAEVEIKALRAQMNPHFLFNSLNSIKNYIVKNERQLAARYLTKFSQLMRLILNNSKNETVILEDELKALELYTELESLRFRDKFDTKFEIESGLPLSTIEIPPLILQPFVENAIWHGLMHKQERGLLQIRVSSSEGALVVEIEDDGVGRQRATELRSKTATRHKSMGMQITADRLARVSANNGQHSSVVIEDLKAVDGQAAGTMVRIKIPLKNE